MKVPKTEILNHSLVIIRTIKAEQKLDLTVKDRMATIGRFIGYRATRSQVGMESKHRQRKQRQMRRKDRYHEKSKRPTRHWERQDPTVTMEKLSRQVFDHETKAAIRCCRKDHTVMVRQTSRWGKYSCYHW